MQWLSISFLKKTPWCDAHRRVNLCRVHHTAESSSAVCIPPRSQTAHHRARIKIFESLWLLLKGQSGEILLGVNTSIMKEKIWRIKFWFAKPKFWLCDVMHSAHRCVDFFKLCHWKSWRNKKYLRLFIRCPNGVESWKNEGQKSRDTLPLTH